MFVFGHFHFSNRSLIHPLAPSMLLFFFILLGVFTRSQAAIPTDRFFNEVSVHRQEIAHSGRALLSMMSRHPQLISGLEHSVLREYLVEYLERFHDLPKMMEREKLTRIGYPRQIPIPSHFLSLYYQVDFNELKEKQRIKAQHVIQAMNRAENELKKQWLIAQGLNDEQKAILKLWEEILDVIVTKFSYRRSQELNMASSYQLLDATDYLLTKQNILPTIGQYDDEDNSLVDSYSSFTSSSMHDTRQFSRWSFILYFEKQYWQDPYWKKEREDLIATRTSHANTPRTGLKKWWVKWLRAKKDWLDKSHRHLRESSLLKTISQLYPSHISCKDFLFNEKNSQKNQSW